MGEDVGAVEQDAAAAPAALRRAGAAAARLGALSSMVAKEALQDVLRT